VLRSGIEPFNSLQITKEIKHPNTKKKERSFILNFLSFFQPPRIQKQQTHNQPKTTKRKNEKKNKNEKKSDRKLEPALPPF
jgi:hypothetical protein